ncbi:MAG: flagellar hook-basal body complex protein [Chromatiales bacterium]|nr:flagellar hook-basal body complex protein [Chromatiales bacterium]
MAEEILRKGNSGDGPMVVKDKALLDQLFRLLMDAQIGPELFQVVAALLAHVFAVEQKRREENSGRIEFTGAAMLNDVERMRVISNNLANLTSVGFKREFPVSRPFGDLVTGMAHSAGRVSAPSVVSYTDYGSGVLKYTAGPLDIALEGSGLLVVDTPGGEGFTRSGSLQLDEHGRLVTQSGHVVQGEGGEIRLGSPEPRIDAEGYVWDGQDKVARLRIVEVIDARTLERLGNGMFAATEATRST